MRWLVTDEDGQFSSCTDIMIILSVHQLLDIVILHSNIKKTSLVAFAVLTLGLLITPRSHDSFSLRLVENGADMGGAVWELRNESLSIARYTGSGFFLWGQTPAWGAETFDGLKWNYESGGWCGNGLATRILLPQSTIRFTAFVPSQNRRLALRVTSGFIFPQSVVISGRSIDDTST